MELVVIRTRAFRKSKSFAVFFGIRVPWFILRLPLFIVGFLGTPMGRYTLRKLIQLPFIIFAASFIIFVLGRYGPGDPAVVRAGPRASPEAVERLRHELGLDRNIMVQYGDYMWGLAQGDLGESIRYPGVSAKELIFPKMMVSAQLGLIALVLTFTLGVVVGMLAAYKSGTWLDPFLISFFLFFSSVPSLILIPFMLWAFVIQLGWLPAAGWEGIFSKNIIIPVFVLSFPGIAGVAGLMRATALSVLGEDYIRTARAKGLSEFVVITRHVMRNAMLPMVTVIGLSLVGIFEGAYFTELLYGIPGIGRLSLEAVSNRDYDIVMSLMIILGVFFVIFQILTDISYAIIDPRIRLDKKMD